MTNQPNIGNDPETAGAADVLKALPQYLLPHHILSRCMHRLTRITMPPVKNWSIDFIVRQYGVDMSEAAEPDTHAYATFNHFFTRALRPEARPVAAGANDVASPVDGTVSQIGDIVDGRIFQAKGREFSLTELLGGDTERAAPFQGGHFATLYLSPRDYHRIHAPLGGRLKAMVHIPGRLFSVSPSTTRSVPRLFARNERVALFFDTPAGPMAVVLVGAIFVASIETVWSGVVTPPTVSGVQEWDYAEKAIATEKGAEIGRFNMGSTVIVLFAPQKVSWSPSLKPGSRIKMGQHLATFNQGISV